MDAFSAALDDEVARSLARKAFAYHVMALALGPVSGANIRDTLLMVWEDAGSPAGAFSRAAVLARELPDRIAEGEPGSPLDQENVPREQQVAIAKQSSAFLDILAREFEDVPPTAGQGR